MTTINLKDFYPWYTHDEYIEVSDEVAAALKADKLYEAAYQRKVMRNKAQYSLDVEDGIERSAVECHILSPEAVLDLMERHCRLCRALNELPEIQGRRVEAHYLLGKSVQEIAKEEGVSEIAVHKAIRKGLEAMKKFLKNM